jgi:hypothetical protein
MGVVSEGRGRQRSVVVVVGSRVIAVVVVV